MRVALLTPQGQGQLGMSFASGLSRDGHDVHLVGGGALTGGSRELILARQLRFDRALSAALRRPIERRLANLVPEVTIVVKGRFLSGRDVEALRRASGGLVVNYFPDNPFYADFSDPAVIDALRSYDSVFIWSRELVKALRAEGVSGASYLPFGYDDELYGEGQRDQPAWWDIAFVGQWSELRERHIRSLAGLRVVVAGPNWKRRLRSDAARWCTVLSGTPHGRAAAAVYRRSTVGLNILHPQNTNAHNMRTWELPSTGTPCVMTASAFHTHLFGDTGVLAFDGPGDIRDAAECLLRDVSARHAVAAAGEAAVRSGTYRSRMRELLASLDGAATTA
jgi:spore maturation protein CgeB